MANPSAFHLPAGVELRIERDGVHLKHRGDVFLESTLGLPFASVEAGGDLTVRLERITGVLRCGGRLLLEGSVEAERLHGRIVIVKSTDVRARAISADREIQLGPAQLAVDAIVAPRITLDPKASGRVTVMESHNEPGPSKIKGGFSLADYQDMFGDAEHFLSDRGLSRLAPPDNTTLAPPPDEEEDDPQSLSIDALEPLDEDEPAFDPPTSRAAPRNPLVEAGLRDALQHIEACYEQGEKPPTLEALRRLIERQDHSGLRNQISDLWNDLLSFHQRRGLRPHHQVTHAFNRMFSLLQD